MKIAFQRSTDLFLALVTTVPTLSFAEQDRVNFKCTFAELCGSLNGVGCYEAGSSFLLIFEQNKNPSIVMYNEVWGSNGMKIPTFRDDLTTLMFSAPSGEMAMLTTDDEWQYSMSIHYTGAMNVLNWESGTGQCSLIGG